MITRDHRRFILAGNYMMLDQLFAELDALQAKLKTAFELGVRAGKDYEPQVSVERIMEGEWPEVQAQLGDRIVTKPPES